MSFIALRAVSDGSALQFTVDVLDQEVKSYEYATFVYKFKPHENFDLRDFGLQINVNYIDNNEAPYRHTPYNGTVQYAQDHDDDDDGIAHVALQHC